MVGALSRRRGALCTGRGGALHPCCRRRNARACGPRLRTRHRREDAGRGMKAEILEYLGVLQPVAEITAWLVICQGLLQSLIYLLQLMLAYHTLRHSPPIRRSDALWWDYGDVAMPIALLMPAYNEEATIGESIRSVMALQYPSFEVIVINDGSKDGTLQALIAAFDLKPVVRPHEQAVSHRPIRGVYGSPRHANLLVIDKEN